MYQVFKEREAKSAAANDGKPRGFLELVKKKTGPTLGIALTIPSTLVAQVIGTMGSDFTLIDMEHSPLSAEMATQLVHTVVATSKGSCFPIVRVPSQSVEWIKWALDSGAAGIIVPMVNNKTEMEQIIDRALFPPRGKRSFGPSRAPWGLADGPQGGIATYIERASNREIAILPMIESAEGVENADEIISTDGVSGVFVGPVDLRLSMGLSGADGNEPRYTEALSRVYKASEKHGKIIGSIGMGPDVARKRAEEGMNFLIVSVDFSVLVNGLQGDMANAAKAVSACKKVNSRV